MTECINKCTPYEYENSLSPTPVESDLVQVYDSIEQITNPNSNHIYVVGNDVYVFDGTRFLHTNECNIPPYTGEYTVTAPSTDDLVLPTKDKLMEDDVTVEANHEIEDELLTGNFTSDVYYNDRVTVLKNSAFKEAKGIKVVKLPYLSTLAIECFRIMPNVEEIYLPRLTGRYYNNGINGNPNLRILDCGTMVLTNVISGNPKLEILILRINNLTQDTNALSTINNMGCPLSRNGSGGYVYVPQSLVSAYQASQLWQQYCNVLEFRPIEGSEYEIDGLESINSYSQSFSLNSPLTDTFDAPLETFDTLPLEDEFIPTEELESEE